MNHSFEEDNVFFENLWSCFKYNHPINISNIPTERANMIAFINSVEPIISNIIDKQDMIINEFKQGKKSVYSKYNDFANVGKRLMIMYKFGIPFINFLKWIVRNKFNPNMPQGEYVYICVSRVIKNPNTLLLIAERTNNPNLDAGTKLSHLEILKKVSKRKMSIKYILNSE